MPREIHKIPFIYYSETNLKVKQAIPETAEIEEDKLKDFNGKY